MALFIILILKVISYFFQLLVRHRRKESRQFMARASSVKSYRIIINNISGKVEPGSSRSAPAVVIDVVTVIRRDLMKPSSCGTKRAISNECRVAVAHE